MSLLTIKVKSNVPGITYEPVSIAIPPHAKVNWTMKVVDKQGNEYSVEYYKRIKEILRLSPNWDGYGALPIDRKSVQFVGEFLEMLPDDIPTPDLEPEPNGDMTMVWLMNGYHLVVGIDRDGIIAWGGTSPNGTLSGEAKMGGSIPKVVMDVLRAV